MPGFIGGDTIGIVTFSPSGELDSNGQDIFTSSTQLVYGCVFEPISRGPIEEETDTITAHERAWVFMPYVPGVGIPTVDTNGNPVVDDNGNPVPATILNSSFLQPQRPGDAQAQRNYKVQGMPEVEVDMDGQPDHVFVVGEWHGGALNA
jgi:hypothetical protein